MRLHSRRSCCVCFWDGTRVGCCCCFCVRRTEEDFERKEIVLIQWNELVRADDAAAAAHRQTRSQVVQILVGIRPPSSSSACAAAYRRRSSSVIARSHWIRLFVLLLSTALWRRSGRTVLIQEVSFALVPTTSLSTKVNNKHSPVVQESVKRDRHNPVAMPQTEQTQ